MKKLQLAVGLIRLLFHLEITMSIASVPDSLGKLQTNFSKSHRIPVYTGEFWTARQRQMHPLHYSISYRASFKPELPHFFIERYLKKVSGGRAALRILDPFGGRGTTTLQANLMGLTGVHNDRSPVSRFLIQARQLIPPLCDLEKRLEQLPLDRSDDSFRNAKDDHRLLPFFHPQTLNEICQLRHLLLADRKKQDAALQYLGLVALSRLHGHSGGFFSVYSFPQISIMPERQLRTNQRRNIKPEYRPIKERIQKKMRSDLAESLSPEYYQAAKNNHYCMHDARDLESLASNSVDLVITSPPFLDKVNYYEDNWMRSWFLGLEDSFQKQDLTVTSDLGQWLEFMQAVCLELGRVLKPGALAVIEVGEVVSGRQVIHLDERLLDLFPLAVPGGTLLAREILINSQDFTKLANCWDVSNNQKGTNTNRCLVLQKEKHLRSV